MKTSIPPQQLSGIAKNKNISVKHVSNPQPYDILVIYKRIEWLQNSKLQLITNFEQFAARVFL